MVSSVAVLKENVASYLGHLEVKSVGKTLGSIQASGPLSWGCRILSSPMENILLGMLSDLHLSTKGVDPRACPTFKDCSGPAELKTKTESTKP